MCEKNKIFLNKPIVKAFLGIYILAIFYMFFIHTFQYGTGSFVKSEYVDPYVATESIETDREPHEGYTLLMFKLMPIKATYYNIRLVTDGELEFVSLVRPIIFPLLFWLPAGFFLYFFKGTLKKKIIIWIAGLTIMLLVRTFLLIECFFTDEVILSTCGCLIGYYITKKACFNKSIN